MKHTIRNRYTLLITGLMGTMILVICLANTLYLEKYYILEKTKTMVQTYEEVNTILQENSLENEETYLRVGRMLEDASISALVGDQAKNEAYVFGYEDQMEQQMMRLALGQAGESARLVEHTDRYAIYRWHDAKLQTSYILFFGFLEGGASCFLRSSVPGIQDSAMISTRFIWIIGLGAIAVSVIVVSFVSRKISRPIVCLAEIADRMAHLDFSARYSETREDEIEILGTSMNHMSLELEKTIKNLQQANQQLLMDIQEKEKIDAIRKEFISNVSHELKTPIALIQGYAEGLLEGVSDDPESMQYYCEVIVDEAGKMNQLVRKLLTLNQIESGINTVSLEDFDLIPVIQGVLHSFNLVIQQKKVQVEFDSHRKLMIRADEFMMEEVIRNYVSNALNHIDGERRIQIRTEETEHAVRVSVLNTGKPIPEEVLDQVWQKFFKVDKARTREYGGSGIGLSIVKAVMDSHGGSCGVYNTEDGVCFWFELSKLKLPALI